MICYKVIQLSLISSIINLGTEGRILLDKSNKVAEHHAGRKMSSTTPYNSATYIGIECRIVIIGGGVAGSYLAMRLGKRYGRNVCLFEKESEFEGRCATIETKSNTNDIISLGIGARRILKGQKAIKLAKELNIALQKGKEEQLIFARGEYHFANENSGSNDFAHLYPKLPLNTSSKLDAFAQLRNMLMKGPERKKILQYPNLSAYIRSVVGDVGFQFMKEMSRFKWAYEDGKSASSYLDFLEEHNTLEHDHDFYPVGGMSQFPVRMAEKAKQFGVRMFPSEPVTTVNRMKDLNHPNSKYVLTSTKQKIFARQIIFALPSTDLILMKGNIVNRIVNQREFQVIKGVRVVTISQWYDDPWWKKVKSTASDQNIWRAWTTDSCVGSFEIPKEPYLKKTNAFRTVYTDQLSCVQNYIFLNKTNQTKLEEQIHQGLEQILDNNNLTTAVKIPKSTKMVVKEWPGAWFFQKGGSPFTNQQIKSWALNPLKGEDISLASDAYNIKQTTWIEGALSSADNILREKYNIF